MTGESNRAIPGSHDGTHLEGNRQGRVVRVIVCGVDAAAVDALRTLLDQAEGVRVVGQVSAVGQLAAVLSAQPAELVLANMDPLPEEVLTAVSSVGKRDDLRFLAVSTQSDPDLILKAVRAGFSEFVRLPGEAARLQQVIDELRQRPAADESLGMLISLIGSAGGVGCTTLAVNLAVELAAKSGREVALVDLDFQFGHVAMMLDMEIQHSVAELCSQDASLNERLVRKAVLKHKTGVHVLARPREFEDADRLTARSCVPLLEILRRMYAYVVVDGPSRSDETGRSILDMADRNLLVVQPLVTSARNAKRILHTLGRYGFDLSTIEVICNRTGGTSHLNTEQIEKSLGRTLLASIPDDWSSIGSAINLGEPLASAAPKSKARTAIAALADTIHAARAGHSAKSGLLGRLFGKSTA